MSTQCNGSVIFQGENIEQALKYIENLKKENPKKAGLRFNHFDSEDSYIYDVEIKENGISFWTKEGHESYQIEAIADKFDLGFEYKYDMLEYQLWGKVIYNPNEGITNIELPEEQFDRYEWNEECECYSIDGDNTDMDSEAEVVELLFNQYEQSLKK